MNTHIPEEYGGGGLGYLDGCLIEEEMSWGCSGIQHLGRLQRPRGRAARWSPASEELKKEYLGRLAEAPLLASFCLTEPDAGSDVSRHAHDARCARGTSWVINGSKCFITNGGYANCYTVYAKTDPEAGHRGISCFVVPRDAGVVVDKHEDKMGQRASNTATITFPDVEIPLDHLIGRGEHGLQARDDDARPHAAGRRGDGHRHRAGGLRVRRRLLARARHSSACRSRCTRRSSS